MLFSNFVQILTLISVHSLLTVWLNSFMASRGLTLWQLKFIRSPQDFSQIVCEKAQVGARSNFEAKGDLDPSISEGSIRGASMNCAMDFLIRDSSEASWRSICNNRDPFIKRAQRYYRVKMYCRSRFWGLIFQERNLEFYY